MRLYDEEFNYQDISCEFLDSEARRCKLDPGLKAHPVSKFDC